jgi:hypothetical protein
MTGYESKKAAALDEDGMYLVHHTKRKDDDDDDTHDALTIAYQSGYYDGKKAAQPAQQEPVAEIVADVNGTLSTQWADWWIPNEGDKLYTAPPQPEQEQNFCPRCGKRTQDIHTCTPPDA